MSWRKEGEGAKWNERLACPHQAHRQAETLKRMNPFCRRLLRGLRATQSFRELDRARIRRGWICGTTAKSSVVQTPTGIWEVFALLLMQSLTRQNPAGDAEYAGHQG